MDKPVQVVAAHGGAVWGVARVVDVVQLLFSLLGMFLVPSSFKLIPRLSRVAVHAVAAGRAKLLARACPAVVMLDRAAIEGKARDESGRAWG